MMLGFRGGVIDLRPGKVLCAVRNYRAHASESGGAPPVEPQFFLKPPSALVADGGKVILPEWSREVEHEVELAVIIGKRTRRVDVRSAMAHILGYSIGIDMTARDIQRKARREGLPWTAAKGFDTSFPVGPRIVPAPEIDPGDLRISLRVNGDLRQDASTREMVHPVERMVEQASHLMTLERMDIIATGTPAGVGRVAPGDRIEASIEGIGTLRVSVSTKV